MCPGRLRMGLAVGLGKEKFVQRRLYGLVPLVGSPQIENIQPFSAKDLSIRSLGDRIRDLAQLKNLYPKKPKDEAFRSHYKREQAALIPPVTHFLPVPTVPLFLPAVCCPCLPSHFCSSTSTAWEPSSLPSP